MGRCLRYGLGDDGHESIPGMILTAGSWPVMAIGFVVTVWMLLAIWALVRGVGMQRKAAFVDTQASRLSMLLDSAPALPMLVKPDLKIEAPERLAQWLGLPELPRYFDDLAPAAVETTRRGGLSDEQFATLRKDLLAAQKGGKSFTRPLRPAGSSRTLLIKGGQAPAKLGPTGSVILWIFDATEGEAELAQLRDERNEAVDAFVALAGLIEAAPFPMWFRGANMQLQLVNQAYVHATGAANAERIVAEAIELVEPIAGQSAMQTAQLAANRGEITSRAIPVTMHGERRMTRVVDVPLGDAGVAGYAIDIQELENGRAEHRRFVDAQRDMLDRVSAAVAQFGPDRQLRFTNQPFRRIFGLERQWLADNGEFDRILEKLRETEKTPAVRDYPAWRDERRGWFSATDTNEEMWLLLDGTHLRVVAQPTPDGGLLLLIEDRTEQAQLASSRDTLLRVRTATFDNLFEAIGVFQADGRLHLWNRRFREIWELNNEDLARHPRIDELLNATAHLLLKPEQISVIQELVRAATIDRRQRAGRVRFADGRHFEFAALPLPDGNALFTMLDVTDSRRMEIALKERNQALEDADQIKSDFLSKMSYELRTPLTSIGGFAEMLAGGYAGELPEQARPYVAAILDSVQHLGDHIDNVLDLSQSEAGNLPLEKTSVSLVRLVRDAVGKATRSTHGQGIDIALQLERSLGSIDGDERRLMQVLDHLIGNAIRYTSATRRSDARVLVHADGDDRIARIVVSDNGPGIEAERQQRLFDLRARRTNDAPESGKGLGLPLARQLVEMHGGTLELVSEPGAGTMVTVILPR